MTEFLIYTIFFLFLLMIIGIFFFRIEYGLLILFAVGVSIQYLEGIRIGPFSALEYVGMAIPLLLVCGFLVSRKNVVNEFNKDYLIKAYCGILILFIFTGVFFSEFLYSSHSFATFAEKLAKWAKLFTAFLVLLIVSAIFTDRKKIDRMLNFMLLSLLIPGSIYIWQILTGKAIFYASKGHHFADAYFYHPAVISYAMIFHFPICLFKYSQAREVREKYFWALIILIFIILIYFTYRRGVWLGLIAQFFTYFFLLQKLQKKIVYTYIFILIVVLLSFTQILPSLSSDLGDIMTFFYNLDEVFDTNNYDYLFTGRWRFYRANLLYLFQQPTVNLVIGNGIEGTRYASEVMGTFGGAHNIYLILLVDFGMICFLAYIFFILSLFSKLFKLAQSPDPFICQYSRILITLLVSYLLMGMVVHIFYSATENWVLWGLIGAIIGFINNDENASEHF